MLPHCSRCVCVTPVAPPHSGSFDDSVLCWHYGGFLRVLTASCVLGPSVKRCNQGIFCWIIDSVSDRLTHSRLSHFGPAHNSAKAWNITVFSNVILLCQDNLSPGRKIQHRQKTTQRACPTVMPQSCSAPQKNAEKTAANLLGLYTCCFPWGESLFCGLTPGSKTHFHIKTNYSRFVFPKIQLHLPQLKIYVAARWELDCTRAWTLRKT